MIIMRLFGITSRFSIFIFILFADVICFAGPLESSLNIPSPTPEAGFEMNFSSHSGAFRGEMSTSVAHWELVGWTPTNIIKPGQTKFLYENSWWRNPGDPDYEHFWQLPEIVTLNVWDEVAGSYVSHDYYHVVVGDIADGFVQETYIQAGYTINYANTYQKPANAAHLGYALNSGGSNWGSASGGSYEVRLRKKTGSTYYEATDGEAYIVGNAQDPLGATAISGNGTANPTRTLVRQLLVENGGTFVQQFLKDDRYKKPVITQNLTDTGISATFELDMSAIRYDQDTLNAGGFSTMELTGANAPADAVWNYADDGQNKNTNAGKYIYVDGAGNGAADGYYTYADGGGYFDLATGVPDWKSYFDAADPSGNPWSYTVNRP